MYNVRCVWYCVINSQNKRKRQNNIRSAFVDNCDGWGTILKIFNRHLIHDDSTVRNRLKGIICALKNWCFLEVLLGFFYFWIETKRNGQYLKNMGTSPNSVNRRKLFKIHWYYSTGKGNHTFRKRVTRFYSVPYKFREKLQSITGFMRVVIRKCWRSHRKHGWIICFCSF